MIHYRIDVASPQAHMFRVTVTIAQPAAEQRLSLPAWIPGSYLVREFARHLHGFDARQDQRVVPLQQLDKCTWLARCKGSTALSVTYQVYAFDSSVRAAFLDADRGFFNGTSVFLRVEGRESEAHQAEIRVLPRGWEVVTALEPFKVDSAGRGGYEAEGYDELVDHPVMLGRFDGGASDNAGSGATHWRGEFLAGGVPHTVAVSGAAPSFDGERLLADTKRICEAEIAFWHDRKQPPFRRYVFMLNAVDDGYGGLEHRASTALVAARRDLPRAGAPSATGPLPDGYVTLLGLISHEYFHTWNVKRLRPAEFKRYDYTQENYTELLWFFEGFTSYYDDLFLKRCGLIDQARYLKLIGKTVNGVLGMPGRQVQSVAQASFDAWVKYYRPDENTINATISYYTKGSLVAMAIDLTLRAEGKGNLDDVMRKLWRASDGGPISEADILRELNAVAARPMDKEIAAWVHGTGELPMQPLLARAGVEWKVEAPTLAQRVGLRVGESALTGVQVKGVLRDSAAEKAGLAAGDELLASNGWRLRRLDDALMAMPADGRCELLVSRDGRVFTLTLSAGEGAGVVALTTMEQAAQPAQALREAWLGG
ncbi:PDZ domain-containing protein [soil metagenome]